MSRPLRVLLSIAIGSCLASAETRQLTLEQAVQLALRQNRVLEIARYKVAENQAKKSNARSLYFPEFKNQSGVLHSTDEANIRLPAGALGVYSGIGLIPAADVLVTQGHLTLVTSATTVAQPLTQLLRIRQANHIAAADVAISEDEATQARNGIALKVHALYFGILATRLVQNAADQRVLAAQSGLRESEDAIRNGSVLKVAAIQSQTSILENQQESLTAKLQLSDLTAEMNDILGLPLDTALDLAPVAPAAATLPSREEYEQIAWKSNPEVLVAMETVRKARAGVTAAKSNYIPDVSVFAKHSYQNGVAFLEHNFGTFGVQLTYDIFDFGKRHSVISEREAQLMQAEANLRRLKEEIAVQLVRGYNKVKQTQQMMEVAEQIIKLRVENERVSKNQLAQNVALTSSVQEASAAVGKAQADLLQAQLAHLLARAELDQIIGRTPGI